jgi:hypothetical protein
MAGRYEDYSVKQIVDHLAAQGHVDVEAVDALDRFFRKDTVISQDEADLLFQINDRVRLSEGNCESWSKLFADSITRFVVFDMNTPGELSTEESSWLRNQLGNITSGDQLSDAERHLLNEIKRHATSFSQEMKTLLELI